MEWQYSGVLCTGRFMASMGTAILNFIVKTAFVTVTYRLIDADGEACIPLLSLLIYQWLLPSFSSVMGVCIVEVDDQKVPTIQYGTMYRIDPALYR